MRNRIIWIALVIVLLTSVAIPNASAARTVTHSETPHEAIVGMTINLTYTIYDGAGDPNINGYVGVQVVSNNTSPITLTSQYWRLLGGVDSYTLYWDFITTDCGYYYVYYNNTQGGGLYDAIGSFLVYPINTTGSITPTVTNPKTPINLTYNVTNPCPLCPITIDVTPYILRPDGTIYSLASKRETVPQNSSRELYWSTYQTTGGQYDVWFIESNWNLSTQTDGFYINFTGEFNVLPTAIAEASKIKTYTN